MSKKISLPPSSTILFQGDSITHAFRKSREVNTAYRLGTGYAFLAAARLQARFPSQKWHFGNEGVCGEGVVELGRRWKKNLRTWQPQVVSILIGVNDTAKALTGRRQLTPEEFETRYRRLLQQARDLTPAMAFILAEPFALCCGPITEEWRVHLQPRQATVRRLAREFDAAFIPLQSLFDRASQSAPLEYWAHDGIHPSAAGMELIAQAWLKSVRLP